MKEFDGAPDKVEVHEEAQQKQEYRFIGSMRLYKGCKLYSFNPENGHFQEEQLTINYNERLDNKLLHREQTSKYKAQYDPNKIYCIASNQKNALRKFGKAIGIKLVQLPKKKEK